MRVSHVLAQSCWVSSGATLEFWSDRHQRADDGLTMGEGNGATTKVECSWGLGDTCSGLKPKESRHEPADLRPVHEMFYARFLPRFREWLSPKTTPYKLASGGSISDTVEPLELHNLVKLFQSLMYFWERDGAKKGEELLVPLPVQATRSMARRWAGKNEAMLWSTSNSDKNKVLLHDWWLIKADSDAHGKQLGLGGFTAKESQGTRGFLSAPIVKRRDAVTLQTADGITITVSGRLNRSRTLNNGFPLKVCNDFVFGFPYYWEEFAALSFDRLETTSENSERVSLDAFPISILPDIFIGNLGHHESSLASKINFDDILLQSTCADASSSDGELGSKNGSPFNIKNTVSTLDETFFNRSSGKVQRKHKGSKNAFIAEPFTNVKRRLMQENNDVADRGVLTSGPITRSRSRLIMRTG